MTMIPSFRSAVSTGSNRHQRRRFWALTLLFVGLLAFLNIFHVGYPPTRQSSRSMVPKEPQHQHALPPELVEFVKNGGFDDSEKIAVEPAVDGDGDSIAMTARPTMAEPNSVHATSRDTSNVNEKEHYRKKQRYHHKVKADKLLRNMQTEKNQKRKKQRYHKPKAKKHEGFPPLDRLVNADDKITGSVDWLLDFAILGHAKCATTYLMNWLRQHDSVQMHDREVCDLNNRQPASLVRKLYTELPAGEDFVRGYKCPGHFSREPLRYFRQYFTKTKLIVGLRHPVRWFESYYNFRIRHPRGGPMPPPARLLGKCVHESQGVCTDRANFHRNLAMLAKTNHSEPAQRALLVGLHPKYQNGLSAISNPVFLYDVGQLYDRDPERKAQFQADLEDFVGLDTPLPSNYTESSSSKTDTNFTKLDICHADFDAIRRELVTIASRSATWITEYFIHAESVVVSSPEYFTEILQTWHHDPCVKSTV